MIGVEQENMNEKVSQEGGKIDINGIELKVKSSSNPLSFICLFIIIIIIICCCCCSGEKQI